MWRTFSRLTLGNVSRWITAEGRDTCKNHFANLIGGKDIGAIADQSSVTTYQTRQVESQVKKPFCLGLHMQKWYGFDGWQVCAAVFFSRVEFGWLYSSIRIGSSWWNFWRHDIIFDFAFSLLQWQGRKNDGANIGSLFLKNASALCTCKSCVALTMNREPGSFFHVSSLSLWLL